MGRANRQSTLGTTPRALPGEAPRSGLLRVGDMVHTPNGEVKRVLSIEINGKELPALPWVGAEDAQVATSGPRLSGSQLSPRTLTPEREVGTVLLDGRERTPEEIAAELGWDDSDVSRIVEDSESSGGNLFEECWNKEAGLAFYGLTQQGSKTFTDPPPPWEERSQTQETEPTTLRGNLRTGDVVESRWGAARVESISLCDPETKDGPEVPLVPWSAAGGRDFVVALSNGHWAYAHQIQPRQDTLKEDIITALRDKPLTDEDLADAVGVSRRDLEDILDDLQFSDESIESEQIFTDNDELLVYSLTDKAPNAA